MYLEERVEQVEALAIDQGKQQELIAKGLAKLTVDTQQGFNELKANVNQVDDKVDKLTAKVNQLEANQNEMRQEMTGMRQDITELKTGQDLILQILREKLT